jgi:hypothetical protein
MSRRLPFIRIVAIWKFYTQIPRGQKWTQIGYSRDTDIQSLLNESPAPKEWYFLFSLLLFRLFLKLFSASKPFESVCYFRSQPIYYSLCVFNRLPRLNLLLKLENRWIKLMFPKVLQYTAHSFYNRTISESDNSTLFSKFHDSGWSRNSSKARRAHFLLWPNHNKILIFDVSELRNVF